ncbi:MAG: hypothetical protein KDK50_00190 [Chlamydiia bacterium]|nr:hypothetical protein [Chlamydiia bacterium]
MDAVYFINNKGATFTISKTTDSLLSRISQLVEELMNKIQECFGLTSSKIEEYQMMHELSFELPMDDSETHKKLLGLLGLSSDEEITDMQSPDHNNQAVF